MIFGSFSIETDASPLTFRIRKVTDHEGLILHPVVQGSFSGGYYLHEGLPWSQSDFLYYNEQDDIMILMSGCIYNRSELLLPSDPAISVPDPELVAGLFHNEGPDFAKRLNGDFAIFIARPAMKQVYLFRDQVGIRPIAWTVDSGTLFFSSDIIGLCNSFSDGRNIDRDYLLGYFKYIDYRKLPDERVNKLMPGHYLKYSLEDVEMMKYWKPEKISLDKNISHDQMLADLRFILNDAVRIRCDRRFEAGAHVSSGIDSGIVSTMAREEYRQQKIFYGFSWSPENYIPADIKFDERALVAKLCEKADIHAIFSDMETEDFPRFVSDFYGNQGHFSEDNVVERSAEKKINLIFSGWGGDEFISTGDRGIETDLLTSFRFRVFFRRNPVNRPKQFVKSMLHYVLFPLFGILKRPTARSFRNDARYIKKPFKKSDRKALRNFYFHTSRRQLHLRLLEFYHLQNRCENWFVMGYQKGVEYRYPLLDKRIIEYMLKVSSELLCKTDYYRPLLREIGEGIVPEEVRWHWQKNDPVYWSWMAGLFSDAAESFMNEVDSWKENSDLDFVDFDLLTEDISRYKSQSLQVESKVLFRALVYLKAIHEFTVDYRKS